MQDLHGPRKAKIQVLHNTATPQNRSPQPQKPNGRRQSLKLTDFPTAVERPSLPVTPAPIRRPSFWGEERDEQGNYPVAEGVPKQEEWVRRFSSYPVPDFPTAALSPLLHRTESGILVMRCQYCGKQNPIAKLEELQRRQSEVLAAPSQLDEASSLPSRQMPESESREAAIHAAEHATIHLPPATRSTPKAPPKPILKQPSSKILTKEEAEEDSAAVLDVLSPTEVPPQVAAAGVEKVLPAAEHVEGT